MAGIHLSQLSRIERTINTLSTETAPAFETLECSDQETAIKLLHTLIAQKKVRAAVAG